MPRTTGSIKTVGAADPRIAMRRARNRRWTAIGVLGVVTIVVFIVTRERSIPVGVPIANIIDHPMSPMEAVATLNTVNARATVETHGDELTVKIPSDRFPERRDGQLALAQQYARADEIVEKRKRPISFLDPNGNPFARADPEKGVFMTR